MTEIILQKLAEIEATNNVTILLAIESGSRAWGFPSPDSDYDVRFIYVRPMKHYLSIDEQRDVIELPVNAVLDISGWDLRKALKHFAKSNATLSEWIQSPIFYKANWEFHDKMEALMPDYFNSRAMFHHYFSMAKGAIEASEFGKPEIKLKKYFYALRTLLSCQWILERNEVPPMEFDKLRVLLNAELNVLIDELLEIKKKAMEGFTIKSNEQLDAWIINRMDQLQNSAPMEQSVSIDREALNEVFINFLR